MIKNYNQFINEGLRSKNIRIPDVRCDNLKSQYPRIQLRYNDEYKISISYSEELKLNKYFYEALENDNINDDIVFENCKEIILYDIDGFTKISDYGAFGNDIKDFNCSFCNNLTSLDGAPKEVDGYFYCRNCENLTSLKGAPNIVGTSFDCEGCFKLTNIQDSPEIVGGFFDCSGCTKLTSLKGGPETVGKIFYCNGCTNLISIEGAPEIIQSRINCKKCNPDFIEQAKQKYGDKVKS